MSRGFRRPSRPVLVLIAIVAAGVALLVTAGLQNTVVYYRTPTEVRQSSTSIGKTLRIGGQVVPASLRNDGASTEFMLTDGRTKLPVVVRGALPQTFREGQGAVVEGVLEPDGVLQGATVAVKHSNEYRPPPVDSAKAGG
jgi:cytochrome c-type biogenesis protein CcmE